MKATMAIALVSVSLLASMAQAAEDESLEAVRASIRKQTPDLPVEQLSASPISGLYHAIIGGSSGYVTADGRYFISGDLFDVQSRTNLTEGSRDAARLDFLRNADLSAAIAFAPKNPRHTITVFTDVDCGYCRKLHSEIAKYNELGIAVRYIAYPRSGPGTPSWETMQAVWCSKDRQGALTRAKLGEQVAKPAACASTAVAAHYALGQKLGVPGTPMILLESGRTVNGYMPPQQLAALLDEPSNGKTGSRAAAPR